MITAGTKDAYYCEACNGNVKKHHRFCPACGACLHAENTRITIFNNRNLRSAFIFFIVYLFVCLQVQFTDWFNIYGRLFWVEIFLAAFTLFHVYRNYEQIKPLLTFNNFNIARLGGCISLAIIASVVINTVVAKMNYSFFRTDITYYHLYRIYSMPVAIMIYSIALNPAIIEELAFRGILYNYLNAFLNERLVITVTGFAFGMMHLSFISLFWLVPFGIFTGIMRQRFGTIWYGVVFHFTFNLIAVLFDLYRHGHL
ncbi:type II CAAX prenyl endopeptidase Rce1 family protein [Parafilimonas sp.]|uniref:CPBP family glutamic-type intramembrane protease n=1 Tax=Parafilimonas sp. TaxID=1969739 RepID=UPI0039E560FA